MIKFIFTILLAVSFNLQAAEPGRYFYEGDGKLTLSAQGRSVLVVYREESGSYSSKAIQQINSLFGIPSASLGEGISLRLISMIDYLEDKFVPGKTLKVLSGYRSPSLNTSLRRQGRLAAKTSYHLEGMAADVVFPGMKPIVVWEYVRSLDCCGVGMYNGNSVHIDSGKPRFWTAETALPKTDEPPLNRNIYLAADKDIYFPGETMRLFFSGVSDYPFGIKLPFKLVEGEKAIASITPELKSETNDTKCASLSERKEARFLNWKIPEEIRVPKGKLGVEVEFCDPMTEMMPPKVVSKPFVIKTQTAPSPHPPQ